MPDAERPSDEKLAEVLDDFCRRLEEGADPDPTEALALHPDLQDLGSCLEALGAVEELRSALLAESEEDPLHGTSALGQYRVIREVGRGGMGVVYEAIDQRLDRRVALKMIRAGNLAGPEERERFLAEARNAARLHHANIVQVFEVGAQEGVPYLALEFVEGTDLDARLRRAPLPVRQAAELVEVLARAMHFAHERHIVHRDLKPANILLSEAGDASPPVPKITDFGLAKRLDGQAGITHTGAVMGTPSYMAPEQAAGRLDAVGPAADVYALGAVLYEALTGRPPFRAATPVDTLAQVLREEPVPPRRLQPLVPADLQTICLKCLSKDIAGRYASANDLADDLARLLRGEPIRARPVRLWGRLGRWARRNPTVAALSGIAAILFALVVGLGLLRIGDAATARAREAGRHDEILANNAYAARGVANTILVQFQELAEALDHSAADPILIALLEQEDRPALQRHLEELHRTDPERGVVAADGKSVFHTWHVLNENAILLADAPRSKEQVVGVAFPGRDYFQGALRQRGRRGIGRVHVSRAYLSQNDGLYKTTLAAAIHGGADGRGPLLGVLCATLATDATLGSLRGLNDGRRIAVLVGRRDTAPPREPPAATEPAAEYLILVHPAYGALPEFGRGKKAEPLPAVLLKGLPGLQPGAEELRGRGAATSDLIQTYEDPMGKWHPAHAGRWLAAIAPVGNTELAVIVQQRDESLAAGGESSHGDLVFLVACALMLLGAGVLLWRRRGRNVALPAPPPPSQPTVTLRA